MKTGPKKTNTCSKQDTHYTTLERLIYTSVESHIDMSNIPRPHDREGVQASVIVREAVRGLRILARH